MITNTIIVKSILFPEGVRKLSIPIFYIEHLKLNIKSRGRIADNTKVQRSRPLGQFGSERNFLSLAKPLNPLLCSGTFTVP